MPASLRICHRGRGADAVAESDEFPVNAPVAPRWGSRVPSVQPSRSLSGELSSPLMGTREPARGEAAELT